MKFGEDLKQNRVPEWSNKYLDYKVGKRLVKAVGNAYQRTNQISRPLAPLRPSINIRRQHGYHNLEDDDGDEDNTFRSSDPNAHLQNAHGHDTTPATNARVSPNEQSESSEHRRHPVPVHVSALDIPLSQDVQFNITKDNNTPITPKTFHKRHTSKDGIQKPLRPTGAFSNTVQETGYQRTAERHNEATKPRRNRRVGTNFNLNRMATNLIESYVHPIEILEIRKKEFQTFLNSELEKVEEFYRQREDAAGQRLEALRQQLHIMVKRRAEELENSTKFRTKIADLETRYKTKLQEHLGSDDLYKVVSKSSQSVKSQNEMTAPMSAFESQNAPKKDYTKKIPKRVDYNPDEKVSYRVAKHKLRIALQELHRSLDLLKSYALLNRTAFRKLDKKYEKMINLDVRPKLHWFMNNVDRSYFVNSDALDSYLEDIEDLYTRYFERGNHKLAAGKLRELNKPHGDKSESALLNGVLMGIGLLFTVEGAWDGYVLLSDEDEELRAHTAFLLMLYAGYFLMLYLFTLFCICCRIWTGYKINYAFIFEFDKKHDLDWRQLSTFPCVCWLLLGGCMFLNFSNWWSLGREVLFLWFPLALFGLTLLIIFLPLPIFWWRSRLWFAKAHWRLLFAGFYAVEFRDLFLADVYCSLAYAVANAELFFCLYATSWDSDIDCSAKESRLFGLLLALPPIWRILQCIRRYWDSKQAFPHLVNMMKYLFVAATAITLTFLRLDDEEMNLHLYIAFATTSAIFVALWDIILDFSLLQAGSQYLGLRNVLAFEMPWVYYAVIIIDPLLRFSWIPLAIFANDVINGTWIAFTVACVEVTRRGLWALFRVENEHCTNIGDHRASREIPLPYQIVPEYEHSTGSSLKNSNEASRTDEPQTALLAKENPLVETDNNVGTTNVMATFKGLSRVLALAHRQDFVKRNREETFEDAEAQQSASSRNSRGGIQMALESDEGSDNEIESEEEDLHRGTAVRRMEGVVIDPSYYSDDETQEFSGGVKDPATSSAIAETR